METCLQSLLISRFRIASSIILRLQVLQDSINYGGGLNGVAHIQEAVLLKQMESLQKLLLSMNNTIWVYAAELDRVCALAGKFLGSPISLIFMKLFPDIITQDSGWISMAVAMALEEQG